MARTTRASKQQNQPEPDSPTTTPATSAKQPKNGGKKRKRPSLTDQDDAADERSPKRSASAASVKEEDEQADANLDAPLVDGAAQKEENTPSPAPPRERPSVGDVPLDPVDAQKILDVLEMADTQGLLDRVFPLPTDTAISSAPQSISFRALLQDSGAYPMRVLRSAVQNLFPISSHPRVRPSQAAQQQSRFCQLVFSLLDQASARSAAPVSLDTILPPLPDGDESGTTSAKLKLASTAGRVTHYALLQRLPTGEFWTSISTDAGASTLPSLPTGHAELVAVLPGPSDTSGAEGDGRPLPTLGSLNKRALAPRLPIPLPSPQRLSTGAWTAYSAYGSFAPAYEGDGVELGKEEVHMLEWEHTRKGKVREMVALKRKAWEEARAKVAAEELVRAEKELAIAPTQEHQEEKTLDSEGDTHVEEVLVDPALVTSARNDTDKGGKDLVESALEGLMTPDEIAAIAATVEKLNLEASVDDLLEQNSKSLVRLQTLQFSRLTAPGGGKSKIAPGTEEWNLASTVEDTLTLLASLRPQAIANEQPRTLIPSPSALRKLHRTLPGIPPKGYYGTLPAQRPKAFRDDKTLHIRSGAALPARPATASPAPGTQPASYTVVAPGAYAYNYRGPGTAGAYPYATATSADPNAHYRPDMYPQQGTAAYPSAAHHYPTATAAYSNPAWYNYATAQQSSATPASSTPGTPAPTHAPSYAAFFGQQSQQRAVANTVSSGKYAATATAPTWGAAAVANGATGRAVPTLPPHLRAPVQGGAYPYAQTYPSAAAATATSAYSASR